MTDPGGSSAAVTGTSGQGAPSPVTDMGAGTAGMASPEGQDQRIPGTSQDANSTEATDVADSSDAESTATNVLAAVEVAAPADARPLPDQLTLWVKPVVQLPQVADPVPFEVPLSFAALEGGTRLAAEIALPTALAHVHAMGSTKVLLQVELAGMAPARALVSTGAAAAGSVRFTLEPGLSMTGTVVDGADGSPVQGALVVALDQLPLDALAVGAGPEVERLPRPYAVTDALGRYTLTNVARENIVRLRASGGDYAPTIAPVATADPGLTRIELGKGTTVTGIVERKDGTRWNDAVVVVSLSGRDPSAQDRPAMTYGIDQCDAGGEYTIRGLPEGNYVALVFDPENRDVPVEFRQVRLRGSPSLRIDFLSGVASPTVTGGLTLDGALHDADGQPLPNESLSLSSVDGAVTPFSEWRVADSDGQGRFSFQGIEASEYVIHRVLDGFERMAPVWEGRVDASQTLSIHLADTSVSLAWEGTAGDGRSWTILEKWQSDKDEWEFTGSAPSSVGAERRATEFQHLPRGRYRAVLMGPGHGATWTDAFEVDVSRPVQMETRLRPGASLPLRVVNADTDEPVVGATVRVYDDEGRSVPQREELTTDLEGLAEQLSVPFGPIALEVLLPGSDDWVRKEVQFGLEILTGPGGTLEFPIRSSR